MPVKGKPKPSGHWTEKVLRITPRCPLAGFKADLVANQGSVREKAILGKGVVHVCFHPKDPNDASKGACGWTWSTPVKPTKSQSKRLGINANLAYADDVSFESSYLLLLKCGCSAHAANRGPSRGRSPICPESASPVPVPDLSGIGDAPPSPSPICRGRGRSPVPDSHRGVRALSAHATLSV
jgi:hypothetical protein